MAAQLEEVHISSMVVHARPEYLAEVRRGIEELPGTEVHAATDTGKLVVVLESDQQTQITDTLTRISDLEHVLGTALVYHQIDTPES